MHILRLVLQRLLLFVFGGLLVALPVVTALVVTFGSPDPLKTTAQESGIYKVFVNAVLSESAKQSRENDARAVLENDGVKQAANAAFSPEVLQKNSETFVDGIYGWLNQKTAQPEFTIDLTEPKQTFVAKLSDYAKQRAAGLPRCTLEQLQQLQNREDILTIPCLPPGVDPTRAAEQFSQDVVKNADFLNDPVISASDLPKDAQGRTFAQQAVNAPAGFSLLKTLPWILGGLILLFGVLTVVLHESRRAGLKRIAWSLLGTGILLVLAYGIYVLLLKNFAQDSLNIANPEFRTAAASILSALIGTYLKTMGLVGAAYVVLAGIIFAGQAQFGPTAPVAHTPPDSQDSGTTEPTSSKAPDTTETNQDNTVVASDTTAQQTDNKKETT